MFFPGVQCYLEFRSYLKANYPKSLPFALKYFCFRNSLQKALADSQNDHKTTKHFGHWWQISGIAQKLKMRRDVKLLYDVTADTIGLQLARIHALRATRLPRFALNKWINSGFWAVYFLVAVLWKSNKQKPVNFGDWPTDHLIQVPNYYCLLQVLLIYQSRLQCSSPRGVLQI